MSINITVNGKFNKHACSKVPILPGDVERLKKEAEEKRRLQRLQEVRAESKNMAKKIREEVAQEKERQLKNLEKVKNQELDCWRQNVLAQKNHDYTNAVFQIGAAHRAAQEENQENEAKKMQRTKAQAEKFRQQIRARRSCQNQLLNGRDRGQCLEFGQQSKTPLKDKCTERSLPVKRKKCANVCFKKLNEYCAAISSNSSESESDYDSSSTLQDSSFLDNCDCEEKATQTSAKISAKLQQTPAVILDVEVSSSDEVIITNPREMTDTHATNNRQFSAVNRNQQTETASHDDGNDGNDQQIESNPSSRYVNSTESQPASQNCNIDINQNLTKKTIKLPKFTQVSDLLNRKHQEENAENSQRRINLKSPQKSKSPAKKSVSPTKIAVIPCSPAKTTTKSTTRPLPKSYNPPPSVPKSPMKKNCTKSPQKSVNKQNKKPAKSLPTKTTSSPKKAAHNIPKSLARTSDISKQTKELMSKEKAYHPPPPSGASSSQSAATVTLFPGGSQGKSSISARSYTTQFNGQNVKVQYYDYKNKFSKSYDQPNNIQREIPVSAPMGEIDNNARQQAEVEKELNVKHNEQIEQLRQRCQERCNKALEREKVRRDCHELTEKLDALAKQHGNLLPSDANLVAPNMISTLRERKEVKMNNAIEELLSRPAIITCPDVSRETHSSKTQTSPPATDINEGINLGEKPSTNQSMSSDSCCSILLGYVDEQRKEIQKDLQKCKEKSNKPTQLSDPKVEKLKMLLKRTEKLKKALLQELNSEKDVQDLIESLTDVSLERHEILESDETESSKKSDLKAREKRLKQKEAILEEKLKEFYELQKKCNERTEQEKVQSIKTKTPAGEPLEIIIKVKATDKNQKQTKSKTHKGPTKLATLISSPIPKKKSSKVLKLIRSQRQNSYDSNSTSYMSLPSNIQNNMAPLMDNLLAAKSQETPKAKPDKKPLNPIIAHYIQRLLGMSRNSIQALGVSSSDIETPSSSIVNTSGNMVVTSSDVSEEHLQRVEQFVEENRSFINDLEDSLRSQNRASLETSLRAFEDIWRQRLRNQKDKNKTPKENNIKTQQTATQKQTETQTQPQNKTNTSLDSKNDSSFLKLEKSKLSERDKQKLAKAWQEMQNQQKSSTKLQQNNSNAESAANSAIQKIFENLNLDASQSEQLKHALDELQKSISNESKKSKSPVRNVQSSTSAAERSKNKLKTQKSNHEHTIKSVADKLNLDSSVHNTSKATSTSGFTLQSNKKDEATQMTDVDAKAEKAKQWAQLADERSKRIAELNELLSQVRKEKQQLLEATLESVSSSSGSNARHSTEYLDLPDAQRRQSSDSEKSNNSSEPAQSKIIDSQSDRLPLMPLEKNKHTAISRDSGICSRPQTAQDQNPDDPASVSSSSQQHPPAAQVRHSPKKTKPPPTIKRFSPQLAEDEVAHELSTIMEVDTPATSRLNNSVPQQQMSHKSQPSQTLNTKDKYKTKPVPFPTFDQYAKELNLDMSSFDPEQTKYVEQEFNDLLVAVAEARGKKAPTYDKFPSISAYLENVTTPNIDATAGELPAQESFKELLSCLRLANFTIKSFPTQKEYAKQNQHQQSGKSDESSALLDTKSLDNITASESIATDESESINIEAELVKRNILKQAFHTRTIKEKATGEKEYKERIFSSTFKQTNTPHNTPQLNAAESGIEKLSTSECSGDLEKELFFLGMKWPTSMRNKSKQANALSSSSTSGGEIKQIMQNEWSSSQGGRPINLRDFLTKELLKHSNSSSSSSTDDSIKKQFINSVLDTLTPSCTPRTNPGSSRGGTGGISHDRQKTSTPVIASSTMTSSSIQTQLFSGESHLSSVHCDDNDENDQANNNQISKTTK